MTPEITLAAIVLVPVIVLMFFRINAALVFLSLCLGSVLVQFVAGDAGGLIGQNADQIPHLADIPQLADADDNTIKIGLISADLRRHQPRIVPGHCPGTGLGKPGRR